MPLRDEERARARDAAIAAAAAASAYLRTAPLARDVRHKGDVDLVTEHDLASEQLIRDALSCSFPGWGFLGEEGGSTGRSDVRWIVDPVDGTTNFAHGLPVFAVAIALEVEGAVEVAVVDAPRLGAVWVATRGGGAFRDGHRCAVSRQDRLAEALLATGFPYDRKTTAENNLAEFAALQRETLAIRRCGAAVLDMAWLADGTFDGYWEAKLNPWDWATGALLVAEAGGSLSDYTGAPFSIHGRECVASNGRLHGAILAALAAARR